MISPAGKRATIYDLAKAAGVSPGTVSRVINNRDRVKSETRERVLRAAAVLKIKPQSSVRTRQVAILSDPSFPDRIGGYAATLTAHLTFEFSRRNIGVQLPINPLEELPVTFLDGLVVVTQAPPLMRLVSRLEKRIPVVHVDNFQATRSEYVVSSDHFGAGVAAARHFLERGKAALAFVGRNYPAFSERLRGFRHALDGAAQPADERRLCLYGPESGCLSAVTRVVQSGADALYVPGSSFEAIECLHVLTYVMGLKVPQDISLIGGENDNVSPLLNPPLTTIQEPLRQLAEEAAGLLDRLTQGERPEPRQRMLPIRLLERASVN